MPTRSPKAQPSKLSAPRPEYEAPPVVEVVLSLQFKKLPGLQVPQLGGLWQRFRREFPVTEDKPPIQRIKESFEPPKPAAIQWEIDTEPVPPRCWFKSRDGSEMIQVQQDRFIFNWQRTEEGGDYPRYSHVRERFEQNFAVFLSYAKNLRIGPIEIDQCEVTYVNHLFAGQGWKRHGQIDRIFAFWSGRHSDRFLGEPEDVKAQWRYQILGDDGAPCGRLNASVEPRTKPGDERPLLRFVLTARGAPIGEGPEGALRFFDLGREYVVRGFTSMTSKRMHKIWERTDV